MRRSARPLAMPAWAAFAGFGGLAIALYGLGPADLALPVFALVVLASIGATVVGVRRHQPIGGRRPWWAILAAQVAFFLGTVVRLTVPGADAPPPAAGSFIPDLLVVPGYLLFAFALMDMLRRRRAAEDDPARTDALLIGVGAALATWSFFIGPTIGAAEVPTLAQLAVAFFPMVDVLLLVIVTHLVLADGARKPALWLLGVSAGAMFAGDLLFAVRADHLGPDSGVLMVVDLLFLVAYVTIAAAALHPSMRTLTEPQSVTVSNLGVLRAVGITVTLVAPTVMATVSPPPTVWNAVVRVGLSVLLTVAILARIVRSNNARARAEQSDRWRATHDTLTDLPNRELLAETIAAWHDRSPAEGTQVNLLFIDLDRFKMINDNWGHQVGDELLRAVATRLSEFVRDGDLVCRIGGDEFVLAVDGASPSTDSLAARALAAFAEPFALSVGDVVVTPSIGVARSTAATSALELIRDADTAMYKAKESGGNAYAAFDACLREHVRTRVGLEQALRGALDRGELAVHYQPIVDLATDELTGFEALMRWDHPQLGRVSPLQFIPIAEETGLIVESGAWLLEEAAAQLVAWRAERPAHLPPLHVSVNLSVRQLREAGLVDVVRGVLDRTGLPASALWLEITESGAIADLDSSLVMLRELADLGVTICIDDFGTGHSSLTYLRRFPARILKIDRSFVNGVGRDSEDESIVRTVIAMAHALGQQVVAEGVETAVQQDWLRALGCDLAQGYLFGAPRPASVWRPADARNLCLSGPLRHAISATGPANP